MISDELQDQAGIYVLGGLDPAESAAFESALCDNAELRALVRELREAAGDLGRAVPQHAPSPELRNRVLRQVALEKQSGTSFDFRPPTADGRRPVLLPWAIAALLLIGCGFLALDHLRLKRELASARNSDPMANARIAMLASPSGDSAMGTAMVAWQPDRQTGIITINKMPPAGPGRDYQLWTVDGNHPDPIDTGIIHVGSDGVARIRFKPGQTATAVKAFAISLEKEGGVPKREGPIVLLGNI